MTAGWYSSSAENKSSDSYDNADQLGLSLKQEHFFGSLGAAISLDLNPLVFLRLKGLVKGFLFKTTIYIILTIQKSQKIGIEKVLKTL